MDKSGMVQTGLLLQRAIDVRDGPGASERIVPSLGKSSGHVSEWSTSLTEHITHTEGHCSADGL